MKINEVATAAEDRDH